MTPDPRPGAVPAAVDRAVQIPASPLAPEVDMSAEARPAGPGAAPPDLSKTGEAIDTRRSRSVELTILVVLALMYTLYFARDFLIPVTFALLLNFLLSPLIRLLRRARIKPPAGAALIVLLLVAGIGVGIYELASPAQRWAMGAPESFRRAQGKLAGIIAPVQQVSRQVDRAASGGDQPGAGQQIVVREGPSLSSRVFGTSQKIVAGMLEVLILLYFLLAGGDLFLQKLIKVLPHFGDKLKAVEIARATEAAVSAYLTTALLVNVIEGAVVALVLWALDMPNPLLWGALIVCLEFVPYIGALTATVVLAVAGLTTFDEVPRALLIPGSFLAINLLQANFVSPLLLGNRLTLNPVAIFIGLAFFFWIWGVPGAFLAVPLLATFKIFCDHIVSLAAIGEFLGQRDDDERRLSARR
ncbi:MAG: hypothetical protein JWL60_2059 [Gemmatimonadetes bacterium]|nr:hypothetical protein [Gemmatimonadota bacterium]